MLAHKIELKLNNKQRTYFSKSCGVARFAYNWALNEWNRDYAAGLKPSDPALRRKLNSIKRKEFPWMLEVSKNAPQMAIIQLGKAFKNFFAKIVIEDLNVKGMVRNRKLSRSISDMGFYEFRRQIEYKSVLKNKRVIIANRWFASSKLCSVCEIKNTELTLSVREWQCKSCGAKHQRDINAAKNLEKLAVSFTVSACGASSDGVIASAMVSHGVLKQESNVKLVYGKFG